MYGSLIIRVFVLTAPITPGAPLAAQPLAPIHRPLYPHVLQSLLKGQPKSGVIFGLSPAV